MTNPNETTPENNETPDLSPMAQDLIQNEAPDEALLALLAELEETADELRVELNARGRNKESLTADHAAAAGSTAATTAAADTATTGEAENAEAAAPHHKHKKINPNVTPEQQAELDENFAKYWTNSKGSWKNLFRLLREFRAEMQEGKKNA